MSERRRKMKCYKLEFYFFLLRINNGIEVYQVYVKLFEKKSFVQLNAHLLILACINH